MSSQPSWRWSARSLDLPQENATDSERPANPTEKHFSGFRIRVSCPVSSSIETCSQQIQRRCSEAIPAKTDYGAATNQVCGHRPRGGKQSAQLRRAGPEHCVNRIRMVRKSVRDSDYHLTARENDRKHCVTQSPWVLDVFEDVAAKHGAGLEFLDLLDEGGHRQVADDVDPFARTNICVDHAAAARAQRGEDAVLHPGLLPIAKLLGVAADVEDREEIRVRNLPEVLTDPASFRLQHEILTDDQSAGAARAS